MTGDSSGMGRKAAGGAAWSSVGRLGSQFLQFLASLVLARLLLPSDFGLIASVLVFTQFSQIFFELGMGAALVQLRELRERDLSTVFWLNGIGGVVFAGLLAAAAPLIADFFDEPKLVALTPIVALSFTLNLGVCHLALLQRALRFKAIAVAELTAASLGFAVSIVAATAGAGVYALGVGPVVQSAASSVLLWSMVRWRPRHFISRDSLPRIWKFSGGMLGFNVVNYWGRNADNLLIGKFVGAASLGYYNRAFNLMTLPVQQLGQVLGRVMFPTFVAMRDDHVRIASAYRRSVLTLNAASVPVLVGLTATAPALVPALWGEAWKPTVPLLMLVCVAGIPQSLMTSTGWLYQSQGRTTTMFVVGTVTSGLGVVGMIFGLQWGAVGVACAVLARSWLFLVPTLHYATRIVDLPAWRVIADTLPTWMIATVMFATVWLTPVVTGLERTSPVTLMAQAVVGVAVYSVGMAIFQRVLVRDVAVLVRRRQR